MRSWFGGDSASFVTRPVRINGMTLPSLVSGNVEIWTDFADKGGVRITDLLDENLVPVSVIVADASGQVPAFQGPDGVNDRVLATTDQAVTGVWLLNTDGVPAAQARVEAEAARDQAQAAQAAAEAVGSTNDTIVTGLVPKSSGSQLSAVLHDEFVQPDSGGVDRFKAASAADLRPFYAAAADRAASPVDILVIGDSISEGEGSGAVGNRYTSRLLHTLRARMQPPGVRGGRGYVPAWYAFASPTPASAGFTASGAVTQSTIYGLGRRSATLGAGGSLTVTVDCSSFDVVYAAQTAGGTFSVSIDGAAATNVDTAGAGNLGGRKQRFTASQRGSHTITIAQVSGSPIVEGIMVYDGDENIGVRLWDGAHYGYTSNAFASIGTWAEGMLAFTADLVVLAIGTNDHGTGVAPATYKTNVQAILNTVRARAAGVPVLLVGMYERAGDFASPWADYITALREIAEADANAVFVDLTRRLPKGSSADPLGLIRSDGVHPTTKGHQALADLIAAPLLDGVNSGSVHAGSVAGKEIGYGERTSDATSSTAWTSPTDLGVSVTVTVTDRPIVVEAGGPNMRASIAGTAGVVLLTNGAGTTTYDKTWAHSSNANDMVKWGLRRRLSLAPGVYTFKLRAGYLSGGSTITLTGASDGPIWLQVTEV